MSTETINIKLNIDDSSLKQTDRDTQSLKTSTEKTYKSVNSLGKEFKKAFGKEINSSLKSVQSAFIGIVTAPIRLAGTAIKLLTKMAINYAVIGGSIKLVEMASNNLAKNGSSAFSGLLKPLEHVRNFLILLQNPIAKLAHSASTAAKAIGIDFEALGKIFMLLILLDQLVLNSQLKLQVNLNFYLQL
jgi:hypothetical protein